jgi:hypothetical protein
MLKASGELGAWERCSVRKSCAPATTWEVQFELTEVNTRSSYKRRNATASSNVGKPQQYFLHYLPVGEFLCQFKLHATRA